MGTYISGTLRERFEARVSRLPSGCWEWTGATFKATGYAMLSVRGASGKWAPTVAHRVSYELHVGQIPGGLIIDHLCHTWDASCPGTPACRHRRCVNPDHLEAVTRAENNRRGRSPVALMLRDDVCHNGHDFTGDNILVRANGKRECRACVRDRDNARNKTPERREHYRRMYAKRKAAASR